MFSPSPCVVCCVCIVNLFVKAKRTLAMYTHELKHISPSFVPSSGDLIYVQYGSTSYVGVFCRSVTRKGIRPVNFDLQRWVQVEKGSAAMFGDTRLECDEHASGDREELAGIQVEVNSKGKIIAVVSGYWD